MGLRVVMLTGDNARTTQAVGRAAGVDQVIAGVLPQEKAAVIRKLQEQGKVAMVGDGINDAPALTQADTGVAIGAGADVAIDAADVVLMKSRLDDVPAAIRLSRATIRNIRQNLFWAFFYNALCIPLAIGLYQAIFGWGFELKPVVGALAMSFSSVTVCLNALRLNLFPLRNPDRDRPRRKNWAGRGEAELIEAAAVPSLRPGKSIAAAGRHDDARANETNSNGTEEAIQMKKTMQINGMMCCHCEATVQKALEALDGVASAAVSHEQGTAVVTLEREVADEVLKKAVEERDYQVVAIG